MKNRHIARCILHLFAQCVNSIAVCGPQVIRDLGFGIGDVSCGENILLFITSLVTNAGLRRGVFAALYLEFTYMKWGGNFT